MGMVYWVLPTADTPKLPAVRPKELANAAVVTPQASIARIAAGVRECIGLLVLLFQDWNAIGVENNCGRINGREQINALKELRSKGIHSILCLRSLRATEQAFCANCDKKLRESSFLVNRWQQHFSARARTDPPALPEQS